MFSENGVKYMYFQGPDKVFLKLFFGQAEVVKCN